MSRPMTAGELGLCGDTPPTLRDRAHAVLTSIDRGCEPAIVRHDMEVLLGDLDATGVANQPIERGDHVMSLDVPETT